VVDATIGNPARRRRRLAFVKNVSEAQPPGYSIKHTFPAGVVDPGFSAARGAALQEASPACASSPSALGDGNVHYNLSEPASATARNAIIQSRSASANRSWHDLVAE